MDGYGILWSIIIGGVAGVIAERLMNFNTGLILSIILGIVGAVVGNELFSLLHISLGGGIIGTIIVAIVGACIIIYLYRLISRRA